MPIYRAAWIVPIASLPVRDAWLWVRQGRIAGVGQMARPPRHATERTVVDLGSVALLPGLVNAHTHLELSWLRGQVAPAATMPSWVDSLLARRQATAPDAAAIERAVAEAWASGTSVIGDVGNTLASVEPLRRSPVAAVVFRELLGFRVDDASAIVRRAAAEARAVPPSAHVRVSLGAHAPYSVAPALFEAIARELRASGAPTTVHLAESAAELEFLRHGSGAWRQLLERLGAWTPGWTPPGCGPVEYLARLGWLTPQTLVVHGVHLSRDELVALRRGGVTLVTCPRSNAWTGAGSPPIADFHAAGVKVAVGTDSLASVTDLDVFREIEAMRRLAPAVPAAWLLESATLAGARALGRGTDYGSLEPGKRARVLAVRVPAALDDVEEYLVRGVDRRDVAWLDGGAPPA